MKRIFLALMVAVCAFAQKPPKPPKNGLYANFKTELGDIKAMLYEKDTPQSVALFIGLAQGVQDGFGQRFASGFAQLPGEPVGFGVLDANRHV